MPGAIPDWSMRPIAAGDEAFLDRLYTGTRIDEVLGWGFGRVEAETFLRAQADMQRRAYALQYPGAEHHALLADGEPAGRLMLDRQPDGWRVVDISVLPAMRGRGLGTWALGQVLRRAQEQEGASGHAVRLQVAPGNRARRLYERLGFRPIERGVTDTGDVAMEWLRRG